MTPERTLAQRAALVLAGEGTLQSIRILYIVLLARFLGIADYGVVAHAHSFAFVFGPVMAAGLDAVVAYELGRGGEGALHDARVALTLRVAIGAPLAVALPLSMIPRGLEAVLVTFGFPAGALA